MVQVLNVRPIRRISRIFLLLSKLLLLLSVLLFFTNSVQAGTTINSATVDGVSSVVVSGGDTISTVVNVLTSGNGSNGRWRSTGWRIAGSSGALTCVNHTNYQSNSGNFTETFNITAPAAGGVYNLYLVSYRDDACLQGASTEFNLSNAITVEGSELIDHIQLTHDGAALTCADESITLTACADAACSSVATSEVTVNLSATGAASSWSQNPVTIPANSNAGVTVLLTHRTAETITLDATSTPAATNSVICIPDCDLTFSQAGFILSLSNHQSCTTPNIIIQAVQMSDTGNSCAPAYSGNQSVNFAFNYNTPATGSRIPILDSSNMAAAAATQNRTINFDGTASATLSFQYNDAGQVDITVSDGADNGLTSATVSPIATPATLLISTSDANNACTGPDYGNCTAFKVAGTAGNA
ncbi:MAG: hypothetical protein ACI9IA_002361, partial [Enterobacterales bacterium]